MIPDRNSGPDGRPTSSRVELVRRISFALCVAAALAWGVWLIGSQAGWWPEDRAPESDEPPGLLLLRDAPPGLDNIFGRELVMMNPRRAPGAVRSNDRSRNG